MTPPRRQCPPPAGTLSLRPLGRSYRHPQAAYAAWRSGHTFSCSTEGAPALVTIRQAPALRAAGFHLIAIEDAFGLLSYSRL